MTNVGARALEKDLLRCFTIRKYCSLTPEGRQQRTVAFSY